MATPQHWLPFASSAEVLESVDVYAAHDDHLPVALRLDRATCVSKQRGTLHLSEEKMRDPEAVRKFQQELDNAPLPAWDIPIDQHYLQWAHLMSSAARKCFPREKAEPRKIFHVCPFMGLGPYQGCC